MIYSLRIFLYLLIKIKNKKSILLIPIETVMLSFRFRLSCFTHSSSSHRRLLFLLQPTSPEINVASVWNPLSKIMASFLYPVIIITFNLLSPKTILPFQVPIYVLIMFASSKSCFLHCITYLFFHVFRIRWCFCDLPLWKEKGNICCSYVCILYLMHLRIIIDFQWIEFVK
jgi:hypothetical protein